MAQVPNDEVATVQEDAIPGRAIPRLSDDSTPADFGAGLGAGLDEASNSVFQADQFTAAKQRQLQARADADANRVVLAQGITALSAARDTHLWGKTPDDPDAVYRQTGGALPDLAERTGAAFQQDADKISATMTPHQQAAFAGRVATMRDSLDLETKRYVYQQSQREGIETYGNAIAQAKQSASNNYRDPASTPQAKDDIFMAQVSLAMLGGKSQTQAFNDVKANKNYDDLYAGVIGSFLQDGNIAGAQKYLNTYKDDMSSGNIREAQQNRINAQKDRIDQLAKVQALDKIADVRAAAAAGLPYTDATPAEYQAAHKHDAERQQQTTATIAAAGTAEQTFNTKTPQEIQETLQAAKPTVGGPGTAQDIESYNRMVAAANKSNAARLQDSAKFAIETAKGWSPINWSDDKGANSELVTRANTAQEVSRQLGVPVSLLSKPEAQQLATSIDGMTPEKKVARLAQLHQTMPTENSYFALLQQIMPHSPVAAVVGQKTDRPSNWDMPPWYDPAHAEDPANGALIMKGESILHPLKGKGQEGSEAKLTFNMPPENGQVGLKAYFLQHTKGIFADRATYENAHYAAFLDAYAAAASAQGDDKGILKNVTAAKAFAASVGTPIKFNSGWVVPPSGMDASKFESTVKQAVHEQAQAQGASAAWLKGIGEYKLQEVGAVGSGRYKLMNGNLPFSKPGSKTEPFIVDLQQQKF